MRAGLSPTISTDVGCVWAAKLFCVRARCEDPGRTPARRRGRREPSIASWCAASRSRSGPAMLCTPPRRLWKIRVSALVARRGARNACARWQSRADFSPSEGVGEWRCGMYGVLVAWMASSVFQSSCTLSTPRGSTGVRGLNCHLRQEGEWRMRTRGRMVVASVSSPWRWSASRRDG